MTITARLLVWQDDESLVEDTFVSLEEGDEPVILDLLDWLVRRGRDVRDALYGTPPQAAPKLPREAWDPDYR